MESNFTPLEAPYPAPHFHGPNSSRPQPGFTTYNPFPYTPSGYQQFQQSPYGQMSEPSHGAFHHPVSRLPPYPAFSAQQPDYRPHGLPHSQPDNVMSQNGLGPFPGAGSYHSTGLHSDPHPDFSASRGGLDVLPMIQPLPPGGPQGFNLAPYLHTTHTHGYSSFQSRRPSHTTPIPPSIRFGNAMQSAGQGRGPMRNTNGGNTEPPHQLPSPNRPPSYERQDQQSPSVQERRPQTLINAYSRRSDRSVSPRTNNRRSFDRYSIDLGSSPSSEESEALNRVRMIAQQRRHERRQALARRAHYTQHAQHVRDPNVPTQGQMQELRDKLRHFLPHELPEDSSTTCDICQKDYSTKHINPSEEEEVAIQLPCKHIFGEHCINTWFETCQKHKNKITCPMCRKLLVEPPVRSPVMIPSSSDYFLSFLARTSDPRQTLSQTEASLLALSARAGREVEGDFPRF